MLLPLPSIFPRHHFLPTRTLQSLPCASDTTSFSDTIETQFSSGQYIRKNRFTVTKIVVMYKNKNNKARCYGATSIVYIYSTHLFSVLVARVASV